MQLFDDPDAEYEIRFPFSPESLELSLKRRMFGGKANWPDLPVVPPIVWPARYLEGGGKMKGGSGKGVADPEGMEEGTSTSGVSKGMPKHGSEGEERKDEGATASGNVEEEISTSGTKPGRSKSKSSKDRTVKVSSKDSGSLSGDVADKDTSGASENAGNVSKGARDKPRGGKRKPEPEMSATPEEGTVKRGRLRSRR